MSHRLISKYGIDKLCLLLNSNNASICVALAFPIPLISCNSFNEQDDNLSTPYLEISLCDISMRTLHKWFFEQQSISSTEQLCFLSF
jgi:hypothetical protein